MKKPNELDHLLHCLNELESIWDEIQDIYWNLEEVNPSFGKIFAEDYPFEKSFDEYPFKIRLWIQTLSDLMKEHREIEQNYSPEADITYIMGCTYIKGELKEMECLGWYHGKPVDNPEYYSEFIGKNKATYEL